MTTPDAASKLAHDHSAYVEGCFRCDLSRAEARSAPNRIPPHLSPEPLLAAIEARGGLRALFGREPATEELHSLSGRVKPSTRERPVVAESRRAFNTARDALRRCRNRGWISHEMADHLCVTLLGSHPYVVYGDAWWTEDEDDDLGPAEMVSYE